MTLPAETRLPIIMQPQPDEATCGPTCLHAVYQFYGGKDSLRAVIERTQCLDTGGTLAVFLACDALRRGYAATIYTYNLQVFDPTWFKAPGADVSERLRQQMRYKTHEKLQIACRGYLEFLGLGGQLRFTDLTRRLIREYLGRSIPILTALSATYLYRSMREYGPEGHARRYPRRALRPFRDTVRIQSGRAHGTGLRSLAAEPILRHPSLCDRRGPSDLLRAPGDPHLRRQCAHHPAALPSAVTPPFDVYSYRRQ